ncbi:hypothetical protein EMIHUDRAFT_240345 [Emiliania huxleyi CCMP1516]|uniref:NUC153 domain-containing protein n=2 Tax=Emiliania huxleyi TaxID=2903 RepID=A0A0D3JG39_EMIH1|nr:hypothetical protein EMIHUDRAFT_240345 [Emiliania huxleyi CCMP1516]EOD22474.1 hypothetical protein EMIHUDRAFT_240345 [Emiliania huxleyi CCMP1516]|eukprot:XP_005774903.1 hypothetical protein EMIHUDRAFT_240345 [Emiliania huxleyi CCMP1516]
MSFERTPRDAATTLPPRYSAPSFSSSALQQSKVQLSWDADESERTQDYAAFLASSSDSDGEADFEFEGAAPPPKRGSAKRLGELLRTGGAADERRRGKKKRGAAAEEEGAGGRSEGGGKANAELELLMMDGGDEEGGGGGGARKGYDVRRLELKQKKGAKGRRAKAGGGAGPSDDGFKLDMDDARFSRLFSSADYAVDPNDPRFRKGVRKEGKAAGSGAKRRERPL